MSLTPSTPARFAALITAAGASSRMGSVKALVDWHGQPLLRHQISVLDAVADGDAIGLGTIGVVLGSDAAIIRAAAATWSLSDAVQLVDNPRWSEGRSTSFEAGARLLAAAPHRPALGVLVSAVDQPIERDIVHALLAAFGPDDDVLMPSHAGRRGHPIVLATRLIDLLARATDYPEGLRDIVRASRSRALPVASSAIFHDLNSPQDLRRARDG